MAYVWPPGTAEENKRFNEKRIRNHGYGVMGREKENMYRNRCEKPFGDDFFTVGEKTERQEFDMFGDQLQRYDQKQSPRTTDYISNKKEVAEKPNKMDITQMPEYRENMTDKNNQNGRPTNAYKRPDSKTAIVREYDGSVPVYELNRVKNKMSTVFEPEPGISHSNPMTPTKAYLDQQAENHRERDSEERVRNGYATGPFDNLGHNHEMHQQPVGTDDSLGMMKFELRKHLPKYQFMPDEPVRFTSEQEKKLVRCVACEMGGKPKRVLENMYVDLAEKDNTMDGWCPFEKLSLEFRRNEITFDSELLRLVCAQHCSPKHRGEVNYEKTLSFIGACLNQHPQTERHVQPEQSKQPAPTSPDVNRETEKLVKLCKHQMAEAYYELDLQRLKADLQNEYSEYNCLKPIQIQKCCYNNHLPLTNHLLQRLIDRVVETRDSPYCCNWKKFATILAQCVPKEDMTNPKRSMWMNANDSPRRDTNDRQYAIDTNVDYRSEDPRVNRERELRERIDNLSLSVEQRKHKIRKDFGWQEGCLILADTLYKEDTDTRGFLPKSTVEQKTAQCNEYYGLDLDKGLVDRCLNDCRRGEEVEIRRYLDRLTDLKNKDKIATLNSYRATRPDKDIYMQRLG